MPAPQEILGYFFIWKCLNADCNLQNYQQPTLLILTLFYYDYLRKNYELF